MLTVLTGFIASVAHVVTGPDHLAAVTPLAIDSRKKSWLIGLSWGVGHTTGVLLIGLLFFLFKEFLPVVSISKHSDTLIGFLLICIGSWAIFRTFRPHSHRDRPHAHFHTKPFLYVHKHRHTHSAFSDHEHSHPETVRQKELTAFIIGAIHGFAGFSHLFALLPSLAFPTVWDTVAYLASFAAGTILTMILFAFFMGIVAYESVLKNKRIFLKWFTLSGGSLAIAIGILWLFHLV